MDPFPTTTMLAHSLRVSILGLRILVSSRKVLREQDTPKPIMEADRMPFSGPSSSMVSGLRALGFLRIPQGSINIPSGFNQGALNIPEP